MWCDYEMPCGLLPLTLEATWFETFSSWTCAHALIQFSIKIQIWSDTAPLLDAPIVIFEQLIEFATRAFHKKNSSCNLNILVTTWANILKYDPGISYSVLHMRIVSKSKQIFHFHGFSESRFLELACSVYIKLHCVSPLCLVSEFVNKIKKLNNA
jgi:hypothetical protein